MVSSCLTVRSFICQTGVLRRQERQLRECLRAFAVLREHITSKPMLIGGLAERCNVSPDKKANMPYIHGDHLITVVGSDINVRAYNYLSRSTMSSFGSFDEAFEVVAVLFIRASVESRVLFHPGNVAGISPMESDFKASTVVKLSDDRKDNTPALGELQIADPALLLATSLLSAENDIHLRTVGMRMALIISSLESTDIPFKRINRLLKRSNPGETQRERNGYVLKKLTQCIGALSRMYREPLENLYDYLNTSFSEPALSPDTQPELTF